MLIIDTTEEFFEEIIPSFEALLNDTRVQGYVSKISNEVAQVQKPFNKEYRKQIKWMVVMQIEKGKKRCDKCLSYNTIKRGFAAYSGKLKQRLYCYNCNRYFFTLTMEE